MALIGYMTVLLLWGLAVERGAHILSEAKISEGPRGVIGRLAYPPGAPPALQCGTPRWAGRLGQFLDPYRGRAIIAPVFWLVDASPRLAGLWRRGFMFLNAVLGCHYCTSVWVAAAPAAHLPPMPLPGYRLPAYMAWACGVLVLTYISRVCHLALQGLEVAVELLERGRVHTHDVKLMITDQSVPLAGEELDV